MPTIHYPKLSPADHKTFSGEPDLDLPDTYDEWLNFQRQQMRQLILGGDTVIETEVNPDEFAEFCHRMRCQRTFDRLLQFAAEKGRGKKD